MTFLLKIENQGWFLLLVLSFINNGNFGDVKVHGKNCTNMKKQAMISLQGMTDNCLV